MKWRVAKGFNDVGFKRMVGVKRATFLVMVGVVKQGIPVPKHKLGGKRRGPKSSLNSYDKLLVMLVYYREYRTFAHIAADYGTSEPQCWRIVTDIECRPIKSGIFHLSGKKTVGTWCRDRNSGD